MKNYLYIGLLGFLGAVLRFFIKSINICSYKESVPISTILINVTGSFILALIFTTFEVIKVKEEIRLGIATGFLGAFTTFSTLCKDAITLINNGLYFSALSYVTVSTLLGLCSAYLGIIVGREYISKIISKNNYNDLD